MIENERLKKLIYSCLAIIIIFFSGLALFGETGKKPLTLTDIMKFKEIFDPALSDDGNWIIYTVQPDRGNGEVVVYDVNTAKSFVIERGNKPLITKDGKWAAAYLKPDALSLEKSEEKEKLQRGATLLETATGKQTTAEKVAIFAFSEDSQWFVYQLFPDEEKEKGENSEKEAGGETTGEKGKDIKKNEWGKKAATLILRHLSTGKDIRVEKVIAFALDPTSRYLVYSTYSGGEAGDGIYIRNLNEPEPLEEAILKVPGAVFNNLSWSKKKSRLAFLFHFDKSKSQEDSENNKSSCAPGLYLWDGAGKKLRSLITKANIPDGWMLPAENTFTWTEDETRLFFGFKPHAEYQFYKKQEEKKKNKNTITEQDLFNTDYLLKKRTVDVWHYLDPRINPQQKIMWEENKKRTYTAVFHLKDNRYVQLADRDMPQLRPVENPGYALGLSQVPYLKEATWDGRYVDVYLVSLQQGTRKQILTRQQHNIALSPGGKYVAYYANRHWHLYDVMSGKTLRLTAAIESPFYDEDHDYPSDIPGYGLAGWMEQDRALFIYDKYDIWQFSTGTGKALNITGGQGRGKKIAFRIIATDPEQKFFKKDRELFLSAYSHTEKNTVFYSCRPGVSGVKQLVEGKKRFTFLKKAAKADRILFTRESFSEFPDLRIGSLRCESSQKISDINPQIKDFLWGSPRLIEWQSLDGIPLQGIVILPENYDKNKRYPILVYFYRFFTDRLYEFNRMVVNHRPNFPFYVSNGYVMFLPDVRFRVGQPGFSAGKCVVTGVQKLIDMGIADPKAVALHGHSWSGYQTAFIITQTDIFAAAIAGAPVANMTSAYSGIRWQSGMARQFQYEKSQSRIGKSLWESPQLYIENSPVFFADRIHTPLLIEHGDRDGAVPWYQAIELYLAMRRLNKDCIFLQYNDESHHLKNFANKLDYSIKMKEYLDHYLKGAPAPPWIKHGVPYSRPDRNKRRNDCPYRAIRGE